MSDYRGRFAPSPTGRLHFGSLVAAVASFARARTCSGAWLVRIEDLDPPRERPGAAQAMIQDLAHFGMHSDEPVLYQSGRDSAYREALNRLRDQGDLFPCGCARKDLKGHRVYPGTCEGGLPPGRSERSLRVRVRGTVSFTDAVQGPVTEVLADTTGAFIVRRADGLTAYQLAVVVDDHFQGITEVVRGSDLLDSTCRQIYLQTLLDLPRLDYVHLPIATGPGGEKLSKQTNAQPVDPQNPLPALVNAWRFLGQRAPTGTIATVDQFWARALPLWRLENIPRVREMQP